MSAGCASLCAVTDETTGPEPDDDQPASPGGAGTGSVGDDGAHAGRRRWPWVLLGVIVVLLAGAGWVGFRAAQAADALQDAQAAVAGLDADASFDDAAALADVLPAAQDASARAVKASSDPLWRAAEVLPWAGRQLRAVRLASAALDEVTSTALPQVVALVDVVDEGSLRDPDGRVDLDVLSEQVAPPLSTARTAAVAARDQAAAIDTDGLIGRVADGVVKLQDATAALAGVVEPLAQAADLAPALLGADGPRTYLVLALNSAELRAAGGIVGNIVEVHVDDGAMTLGAQRSTSQLGGLDEPVLPVTDDEAALYGDRLARYVQNAVETPDFPRSAQLVVARWEQEVGGRVDGVVATDPVAVSYLLGALGTIPSPDGGTLDQSTFLEAALRRVYVDHPDGADSDAFFAALTTTVFDRISRGGGEPRALISALQKVVAEQRLRVWSAVSDEEARLVDTSVGAAFLTGANESVTGVFLDDSTAGKLGYDLHTAVSVEQLDCTGTDPYATMRLDLSFDPTDDVASLPDYVLGTGQNGVARGSIGTRVSLWSPVGAALSEVRQDDAAVGGQTVQAAGRSVLALPTELAPGGQTTFRFDVPLHDGEVQVWSTPTLTQGGLLHASCG